MDESFLAALAALPARIDEWTAKVAASNARLREQVVATQGILAELGIMRPQMVVGQAPAEAPPPSQGPQFQPRQPTAEELEARMTPEEREAREEQLRYLASRRAERDRAKALNHSGGGDA